MDGEMNHSYVSFLVTCQIVWPRWEEGFGSRVSSWSLITHSRMVLLLTEVWCGLFKNKDGAHSRGWAAHVHSDHTEDHSCDFLTLMNLCLIWIYLAAVCADSECGTVGEGDFPYVSVSLWCHFAHKPKHPTLGCLQQLFCLTCMFCADVLWFTSWQVWASIFASVIALLTHTCRQFTFHRFRHRSLKLVRLGGSSRDSQWVWLSGRPLRISHCWMFICWLPPYMSWDRKKEADVASCGWRERSSTFSL